VIAVAVLAAASALASLSPDAGAGRPPLALAASPTRLQLTAGAWSTVRVTNPGLLPLVVDASTAGFGLDLRGRPYAAARDGSAAPWVALAPRRLTLGAGQTARLTVSALVPPGAGPGDHTALVLLRTQARVQGPVPIVMQVGVVVIVRVRGRIVHRLEIGSVRLRRRGRQRALLLTLRNRGNVAEVLPRRRVRVVLRRGSRLVSVLVPPRRELLPHAAGVIVLRYGGHARGWVRASVELRRPRPGVAVLRRSFRIRL
jgi:hypothetical protein